MFAALLLTGAATDEEYEAIGDQLASARIELHGCREELQAAKQAVAGLALQATASAAGLGGRPQADGRQDGQVRSSQGAPARVGRSLLPPPPFGCLPTPTPIRLPASALFPANPAPTRRATHRT